MANIEDIKSTDPIKLLYIGDSGSGKTGSLASLCGPYSVRVIDLDNGLPALRNELLDPTSPYKNYKKGSLKAVTITEKASSLNAVPGGPKSATVWNRLVQMLNHWKDGDEDLGPVASWTTQDILVIDSLTFAGYAAMNFATLMNANNKNQDGRMNYFHAQNYLEHLIQFLYGDDIKCHVIITGHITFIGDEMTILHGYPATIGRALSPKVGRYFNSVLMAKSEGTNRRIYTQPVSRIELKNSAPLRVKPYYDLGTGLLSFFTDVQSGLKAFE